MFALSTSPDSALRQADEHARLYPRGALSDDREVIAVDALARLWRLEEARARAERFRAERPRSPSVRRLERILGR
jgi:hypothetical protein